MGWIKGVVSGGETHYFGVGMKMESMRTGVAWSTVKQQKNVEPGCPSPSSISLPPGIKWWKNQVENGHNPKQSLSSTQQEESPWLYF